MKNLHNNKRNKAGRVLYIQLIPQTFSKNVTVVRTDTSSQKNMHVLLFVSLLIKFSSLSQKKILHTINLSGIFIQTLQIS